MKQLIKHVVVSIALLTSPLVMAAQSIVLMVNPGCRFCSEAESILGNSGVKYQTRNSRQGAVPRLYVDGQYIGTGVDAVQSWVDAKKSH